MEWGTFTLNINVDTMHMYDGCVTIYIEGLKDGVDIKDILRAFIEGFLFI